MDFDKLDKLIDLFNKHGISTDMLNYDDLSLLHKELIELYNKKKDNKIANPRTPKPLSPP